MYNSPAHRQRNLAAPPCRPAAAGSGVVQEKAPPNPLPPARWYAVINHTWLPVHPSFVVYLLRLVHSYPRRALAIS